MKRVIIAGGTFAAIVIGAMAVAVAGAQTGSSTATPSASDAPGGTTEKDTLRQYFLNDLATRLGVSVDVLKGDIKESEKAVVDKALADGKISQEEADAAKTRIDAGEGIPFHFGFGDGPHHGFVRFAYNLVEETAKVLGIDESDVATSVRGGSSLEQIANDHGMSSDAFKTALLAQVKTDLDAKVASGDLEQARADEIYAKFSENIDAIVTDTKTDPGPPFGPRWHRDGHGPGFWFGDHADDGANDDSSVTPSAITTTF